MLRIGLIATLIVAALVATDLRERAGRALFEAGLTTPASLVLAGDAWRGAALFARGRYEDAAAAFDAEDSEGASYNRGTALARAGRLRDAVAAFDAALEQDPNDEDARFNLALVESLIRARRGDGPGAKGAAAAGAQETKRSNTARDDVENETVSTGEGAAGDRHSDKPAQGAGPSKASQEGSTASNQASQPGKATGSVGSAGGAGRTGDANLNVARPPEQLAHRLPPMQLKTVAASQRWLETLPDDPGTYLRRRLEHERAGRKERGVAAPVMTDRW